MADRDFASITGALAQVWGPQVRRVFNANCPGLMLLAQQCASRGSGKNVTEGVELDGEAAETYSDGADASSYTVNTQINPVLQWGLYRANGKVSNLARDAAGSSPAPGDLVRLVGRELNAKSRALALKLGTDLYSGTGTNVLNGFDTALRDDNTYATYDRTSGTYAKFRGNLIDPGSSTAITKALIRADLSQIYDNSGYMPSIGLCSTAVWNKIAALFDSSIQHLVQTDAVTGGLVMRGGVQTIEFDGCTFVKDRLATANRIYYLSPEGIAIKVLPKVAVPELGDTAVTAPLDTNAGPLPLEMFLEALARTGAAQKFSAYVTVQMLVASPLSCGMRLNVSTS
jgi:hypothetical protein